MGTYATADQVRALAHPDAMLPDGQALEAVILDAEQDVRIVLGILGTATVELAFATAKLTPGQLDALARAVTRAVEHRLTMDVEDLVAGDSFMAGRMSILRQGVRPPSPAIEHALAGHGLIARRICAPPAAWLLP